VGKKTWQQQNFTGEVERKGHPKEKAIPKSMPDRGNRQGLISTLKIGNSFGGRLVLVLGFELRASNLLGRRSIACVTAFGFSYFLGRISHLFPGWPQTVVLVPCLLYSWDDRHAPPTG
jgi:hypothetical protein